MALSPPNILVGHGGQAMSDHIPNAASKDKKDKIIRTASRHATPSVFIWIASGIGAIVVAACIGVSAWCFSSVVSLKVDLTTETAVRAEAEKNIDNRISELKEESNRQLSDFKTESDRRFSEIQKQLEVMNSKLDKLMTIKAP